MIRNYFFKTILSILLSMIFLMVNISYSQSEFIKFEDMYKQYKANYRNRNNRGPMSTDEILKLLKQAGGKKVSLEDGTFFLQWFPDNWNKIKTKHIVITLHGSGGHAERMFNFWYRNRKYHNFAIIALQYAKSDEKGNMKFQNSYEIYKNLRHIIEYLRKSGFYKKGIVLILHGFSRGSARIFELAALDRANDGMHVFSSFIADSGSSLAENYGRLSPFLNKLSTNAYSGARFWLYTGTGDHRGRTSVGMQKMKEFIEQHSGKVDELFLYDTNSHGIFLTGGPRRQSRALNALFSYIKSIKPKK